MQVRQSAGPEAEKQLTVHPDQATVVMATPDCRGFDQQTEEFAFDQVAGLMHG